MFSVVSFDDAEVKNAILDHELYAEKTLLLVGIYTRTVFEQIPRNVLRLNKPSKRGWGGSS